MIVVTPFVSPFGSPFRRSSCSLSAKNSSSRKEDGTEKKVHHPNLPNLAVLTMTESSSFDNDESRGPNSPNSLDDPSYVSKEDLELLLTPRFLEDYETIVDNEASILRSEKERRMSGSRESRFKRSSVISMMATESKFTFSVGVGI